MDVDSMSVDQCVQFCLKDQGWVHRRFMDWVNEKTGDKAITAPLKKTVDFAIQSIPDSFSTFSMRVMEAADDNGRYWHVGIREWGTPSEERDVRDPAKAVVIHRGSKSGAIALAMFRYAVAARLIERDKAAAVLK